MKIEVGSKWVGKDDELEVTVSRIDIIREGVNVIYFTDNHEEYYIDEDYFLHLHKPLEDKQETNNMSRIKQYILDFFKMIERRVKADKVMHFSIGYILFDLSQKIFNNVQNRDTLYLFIGLGIVTLIAFLKEYYDKQIKKSKFDWIDLSATVIGALMSYLVY